MSIRYLFSGALALAVASSALSAPAWAQAVESVQPAPSASSLITATNAMLRPDDVVDALVQPMPSYIRGFTNGFSNPPERGDQAYFVCDAGLYKAEQRQTSAEATGFSARSGLVEQQVYQYESAAAAQRAWTTLSAAIAQGCVGATRTNSSVTTTVERIAGIDEPGWAVLGSGDGSAYSTVHLLGDAIQLMTFNNLGNAMPRGSASAVQQLSVVLAQRWLQRTTLPVTQDPILTRAESSMLRPEDVPSSLPILSPQAGAWSEFIFEQPGSENVSPCVSISVRDIPGGQQSFRAGLGGSGFEPPFTREGSVSQGVSVYATQAAAQRAWDVLTRQAKACSTGQNEPVAGNKNLERTTNGVSELSFAGLPGIWSRQLTAFDGGTLGGNFSVKTYSIFLLMGDAIQQVTYSTGRSGLRQVPLDQLPVNQLAEELANRWVGAANPPEAAISRD